MNTIALQEYNTKYSDGYLGAIKATGNKSHEFLYGGDLSKAIKKSLQEVLYPDLKKSDVKTSCKTYTGGQNVTITLKLDKRTYAPTVEEFKNNIAQRVKLHKYLWIWQNENGQDVEIFHEKLWNMTTEEQDKAASLTAEYYKKWHYDAQETTLNNYHLDDEIMLNEKGKTLIKAANQVIKAYNHDDSNAMVDYFDTNFYYTLKIEWV